MSNEALIEQMLWIAYENDLGIQLAELAGESLKRDPNKARVQVYEECFYQLGLKL
jgi:hypothetical protein